MHAEGIREVDEDIVNFALPGQFTMQENPPQPRESNNPFSFGVTPSIQQVASDVDNPTRRRFVEVVIYPCQYIVNTRQTLLTAIAPPLVHKFIYRYFWSRFLLAVNVSIWLFCSGCTIMMFCGFQEFIPVAYVPICIVFDLYFMLFEASFLIVFILKKLLRNFSFIYMGIHILSFCVCMSASSNFSLPMMVGCLHTCLSVLHFTFYDAYPLSVKRMHSKFIVLGVLSFLPVLTILYFPMQESKHERRTFRLYGYDIVDFNAQAAESLFVLIVYFLRVIFVRYYAKSENSMLFLTTRYSFEKNGSSGPRNHFDNSNTVYVNSQVSSAQDISALDDVAPYSLGVPISSIPSVDSICNMVDIRTLRLADKHAAERSNIRTGVLEDPKLHRILGIHLSVRYKLRVSNTVFHRYVKGSSRVFDYIFRSNLYSIVGSVICFTQATISAFVVAGLLQDYGKSSLHVAGVSVSIVYLTLHITLASNIFVVKRTVRSFDFWFVVGSCFQIITLFGFSCNWDGRFMAAIFYFVCCLWALMLDAYPLSSRKFAWYALFEAIASISYAIITKFQLVPLYAGDSSISVVGVDSSRLHTHLSTAFFSISIFFLRFLYTYVQDPSRILFLSKHWELCKVEQVPNMPHTQSQMSIV
eukprot:TRINITY_DN11858_c0_g1_i3.p1 TRINITY_DN11858_c0_g1~~TRINITY_DN11858_c0_g1_i3.p1  ORF type:complete len:640 (+),score=93.82 TRINITY_DN11858_c0_g1_i3:148-2067(+)